MNRLRLYIIFVIIVLMASVYNLSEAIANADVTLFEGIGKTTEMSIIPDHNTDHPPTQMQHIQPIINPMAAAQMDVTYYMKDIIM